MQEIFNIPLWSLNWRFGVFVNLKAILTCSVDNRIQGALAVFCFTDNAFACSRYLSTNFELRLDKRDHV